MAEEYRISELAQKAGVTKRTIHYYVGRGLLPPPSGAGVASIYHEEHLLKLLLIKKFQEQYLPLDKIRELIADLSLEEARELLENKNTYESQMRIKYSEAPVNSQNGDLNIEQEENNLLESLNTNKISSSPISIPTINSRNYIRYELGLGIELHFPVALLQENSGLIKNIEKYARKLIGEK